MKGNFDSLVVGPRPVVIDFHALWCGPCKVQSPILREVAAELGDKIRVIKIDVDRNPGIASRFHIQGVPTLMIFKGGEVLYKQAGLHSKNQLLEILSKKI
jgi:thioredoxin 1